MYCIDIDLIFHGGDIIFIEERHQKIIEQLEANGRISAAEIQNMFHVSFDTARRDLRILEEKCLLKRTYGGALPITHNKRKKQDRIAEINKDRSSDNIIAIAFKAASLIEEQDVIFISTADIGFFLAQNIPENRYVTVVTNSIIIAERLRTLNNIHVIITGGKIDKEGYCLDKFTLDTIRKMRFDKCFITSNYISADFGLSIKSSDYIELINAIIRSSRKSIGLYTTEKIGYESIISICPANKLDVIITNWDAPNDELKKFDEQGIEVIVTDKPICETN